MTYEFCTLFDAKYLPRGLVLYRSLAATCDEFHLRVFCMDEETRRVLKRLELPGLEPIALAQLEAHDRELAAVKPTRTPLEYCWTATPAVCLYCLECAPELDAITYLDADLMFFAEPRPIFDELGEASVLITPHRYAPRWQAEVETNGVYNVQFMTFRRTEEGLAALRWWRERCIEWCYFRLEDGKLGDQKYLDDWPERFEGVHVLEHPGGSLAPWNVERYALEARNGSVLVDRLPLIFYHYQSLRLYRPATGLAPLPAPYRVARSRPPLAWTTAYPIFRAERRLVWEPYLDRLAAAIAQVRRVDPSLDGGVAELSAAEIARVVARRTIPRRARRLLRWVTRLGPDSIGAFAGRRHRGSWRSTAVAAQMAALTAEELEDPDAVPPYRVFLEAVEALLHDFPLPEPARILDLGCGTGHYSELLERAHPGRFVYTGCDYAPEMVEEARRRWPGRDFVVGDILSDELDLDRYDVVLASALVDVLPDYERGLNVLLGCAAPHVLLHRQQITERQSRVDVAPGYDGQTTYRVFLNLDDLRSMASRHNREIARTFPVEGEVYSFLLARG